MADQIRQGDILLVPVESFPKSAKPLGPEPQGVILAYGEQTGHHHRILDPEHATLYGGLRNNLERYLEVTSQTSLVHEEHGTLTVEPGKYRVVRKREHVAPDAEGRARTRTVYD